MKVDVTTKFHLGEKVWVVNKDESCVFTYGEISKESLTIVSVNVSIKTDNYNSPYTVITYDLLQEGRNNTAFLKQVWESNIYKTYEEAFKVSEFYKSI